MASQAPWSNGLTRPDAAVAFASELTPSVTRKTNWLLPAASGDLMWVLRSLANFGKPVDVSGNVFAYSTVFSSGYPMVRRSAWAFTLPILDVGATSCLY